jgi:chemotaxis protein CheD
MTAETENLAPINYFLEPGYIFLSQEPAIISVVLGSSVSVSLYDRKRKIGGMNHFQYPYIREKHRATAIYGNAATIMLIRMMLADGSKIKDLEAQILGGAFSSDISQKDIGRENIMTARKILRAKQITVVSEDVGGEKGRKIVFNTSTNEVAVMKVEKLRLGDWYPYENMR